MPLILNLFLCERALMSSKTYCDPVLLSFRYTYFSTSTSVFVFIFVSLCVRLFADLVKALQRTLTEMEWKVYDFCLKKEK